MDTSFQGKTETGKDEWLTPPFIIKALGPFDLDPCSPINRPWPTAINHYTKVDDGLSKAWNGRIWCNPPYDNVEEWLRRSANHGNAIGLCWASTETGWFFKQIWSRAHGVLFLNCRLAFYHVDGKKGGSPGKGSVLVGYGQNNADRLRTASTDAILGKYIQLL